MEGEGEEVGGACGFRADLRRQVAHSHTPDGILCEREKANDIICTKMLTKILAGDFCRHVSELNAKQTLKVEG